MSKQHILFVIGARPQFIKSAPLIKEIISHHKELRVSIVHSGQHYDPEMSDIFFRELRIPEPVLNLHAGSGSHATQTATIMRRLESVMMDCNPSLVIVPGDTNTTLAGALVASKLGVPVAHLEAGLRSGDMTMPEEVNRRLTDHCSNLLFAPTQTAVNNLSREGLQRFTYLTGDTMVDSLIETLPHATQIEGRVLREFDLAPRSYVLATLHRPANVDEQTRLRKLYTALREAADTFQVIFPVHPRTRLRLAALTDGQHRRKSPITLAPPQGYVENLALLRNARCLVTDSGGMQKEAFMLHIPCVTVRTTTEWPETLKAGANRLVSNPYCLPGAIKTAAFDPELRRRFARLRNPFGTGHAAIYIGKILRRVLLRL